MTRHTEKGSTGTVTTDPPSAAALAAELTGPLLSPDWSGYGEEVAAFDAAVRQ